MLSRNLASVLADIKVVETPSIEVDTLVDNETYAYLEMFANEQKLPIEEIVNAFIIIGVREELNDRRNKEAYKE